MTRISKCSKVRLPTTKLIFTKPQEVSRAFLCTQGSNHQPLRSLVSWEACHSSLLGGVEFGALVVFRLFFSPGLSSGTRGSNPNPKHQSKAPGWSPPKNGPQALGCFSPFPRVLAHFEVSPPMFDHQRHLLPGLVSVEPQPFDVTRRLQPASDLLLLRLARAQGLSSPLASSPPYNPTSGQHGGGLSFWEKRKRLWALPVNGWKNTKV